MGEKEALGKNILEFIVDYDGISRKCNGEGIDLSDRSFRDPKKTTLHTFVKHLIGK